MTTNLDRIAKLEKTVEKLGIGLTAAEKRIAELEDPGRDPRSTTGAHVERAPQFDYERRRPASFGFGKETASG